MQHLDARAHIVDLGKADANMFGRAPHRGIDGVQIKISRVFNITRHHRALKKMDIIHFLHNTRRVINIGQIGFAIVVLLHINNMHRRPGRAIMHARAGQLHVMFCVLPAQRDMPGTIGQGILDKRPWKPQPPVITQLRPGFGHIANA